MMVGMRRPALAHDEERVRAPARPPSDSLRDRFFVDVGRLTGGLVRGEHWRLRLGLLTLIAFGEPEFDGSTWTWPITGGLLARRPGGSLSYGWREGALFAVVDGYAPRLPAPLYVLTQVPVHRLLTRRFLLGLRGRVPMPGPPAGPAQRLLTATLDLALCAAATAALRPRRRLVAFAAVAAAYHVACWTVAGRTAAALLTGQRVVSVDGSAVTAWQALLRLAALPLAAGSLRAVHDEVSATEVIEA